MAGPLIYLPGAKSATAANLTDLGLRALLDPMVTMMVTEVLGNGPDGGCGCLVHWDSATHPEVRSARSINRELQDWAPAVPDGDLPGARFWLGLPNAGLPPTALRRQSRLPGHAVQLRDGNKWEVPAAYWQGDPSLPCQQGLDPETGYECRTVLPEHQAFQAAAQDYFRLFLDDATPEEIAAENSFTVDGGFDYAVMALAKNYRVSRDMVSRLGLLGDVELAQVITATLGVQAIAEIEEQKKNEACASTHAT